MTMATQRNRKTTIYTAQRDIAFKSLIYLHQQASRTYLEFRRRELNEFRRLDVQGVKDICKDIYPKHFYDTLNLVIYRAILSGAFGKRNMQRVKLQGLFASLLSEKGFGIAHENDRRGLAWISRMAAIHMAEATMSVHPSNFHKTISSIMAAAISTDPTARGRILATLAKIDATI